MSGMTSASNSVADEGPDLRRTLLILAAVESPPSWWRC